MTSPPALLLENCDALVPGAPLRRIGDAAVLLGGDVILAVGPRAEVVERCPLGTRRLDLGGAVLLPGLVDAHCHFTAVAEAGGRIDLRAVTNRAEVETLVAETAARTDGWVLGRGHDPIALTDGPLTRELLDRAAPGRPVVLVTKDGHSLSASTEALRAAGIDPATWESPPGGDAGRQADGDLNGILYERAMDQLQLKIPARPEAARVADLIRTQGDAWSVGLVGVHEMAGTDPEQAAALFPLWQAAEATGDLRLRSTLYLPLDSLEHLLAIGLTSDFGSAWVRLGGVKFFLDGSLGSLTAHMVEPFCEAGGHGLAALGDEALVAALRRCRTGGLSPAIHAIGDMACRRALDALAAAAAEPPGGPWRPRLEHLQLVHPDDRARLRSLGVTASMQPGHCPPDIDKAERWWGAERAAHAYAWREMLDDGVPLAFGSDAPVEPLDPWVGIEAAIHRRRHPGEPGWHLEHALTPLEAIAAHTAGAAAVVGLEGITGALAPGCWADLVAVDALEETSAGWNRPRVLATWVGGDQVFGG